MAEKPKILYLSDSDFSKPGGAQQSMQVLMEGLKDEFEIYIITPRGSKKFENQIVLSNYQNFKLRGKTLKEIIKMTTDIYMEINEINPNIIHVQMTSSLVVINFLVKFKLLNSKIKLIYTDRGVYGKYGTLTKKSIDSFIPVSEKMITTTEVNKNNYKNFYKKYNKYQEKFEVIYNTAGKIYDEYNEKMKVVTRKKLNIDNNKIVIGFCGRFSEQKNWPLAKEIIEKSYKSFGDNLCFVVCLGTEQKEIETNKAKNFINELIRSVGKQNIRSFVNLENEEVSQIYYSFDFFILTSKWESFGRTAVEAMSRKNVVFGTDVDGLSEVIGNKDYLFSDSEELLTKLTPFIKDSERRLKAIDYFYNRYHSKFGYSSNIFRYKQLYNNLLM